MTIENIIEDGKITGQIITTDASLQTCIYSAEAVLNTMSQLDPDEYDAVALVDVALFYIRRASEILNSPAKAAN